MATSRSFNEFARRMNVRAEEIEERSEQAVRASGIAIAETATIATPVDEGRARGGWLVGLGSPPAGEGGKDTSGGSTVSRARGAILRWKKAIGFLFIGNNVPYIVPLNNGSSRQAPSGMTQQALLAGRQVLRRFKLLRKS